MKKIIVVFLILTMVSCQQEKFKTSVDLAKHVVELSMSIPFSDYSNITATGGDLKRRMKARYKVFKPYLNDEMKMYFEESEVYWQYINSMSDHQYSMETNQLELTLVETVNEEDHYQFEVMVTLVFENNREPIIFEHQGQLSLKKVSGKWKVSQYEIGPIAFE